MVIQRLQNLYLALAAILLAVFSFIPYIEFSSSMDFSIIISTLSIETIAGENNNIVDSSILNTWSYLIIAISIVVVLLITIFNFKNLKFQKKLSWIGLILTMSYLCSLFIYSYFIYDYWNMNGVTLKIGIVLPLLSILFICLAIRNIKKDIKLLSSYDRIR